MIWTLWIQIGQPYRKVLCNKPAPIIAWNPWMWSADFKQNFLPKTPFGRVNCIFDKPAKNSSHKVQKLLRGVREKQRTIYFQFFFLEFVLWIRRLPLWRLFWQFLGKSLKLSFPKSKMIRITLFAKFVPSENSSSHFPDKILTFFPWNSASVELIFSKFFFVKMLVWTSGMKLWWCLRHFSPESWKSSAQVHKLMEKNDFFWKFFPSKNSSGHIECSFS